MYGSNARTRSPSPQSRYDIGGHSTEYGSASIAGHAVVHQGNKYNQYHFDNAIIISPDNASTYSHAISSRDRLSGLNHGDNFLDYKSSLLRSSHSNSKQQSPRYISDHTQFPHQDVKVAGGIRQVEDQYRDSAAETRMTLNLIDIIDVCLTATENLKALLKSDARPNAVVIFQNTSEVTDLQDRLEQALQRRSNRGANDGTDPEFTRLIRKMLSKCQDIVFSVSAGYDILSKAGKTSVTWAEHVAESPGPSEQQAQFAQTEQSKKRLYTMRLQALGVITRNLRLDLSNPTQTGVASITIEFGRLIAPHLEAQEAGWLNRNKDVIRKLVLEQVQYRGMTERESRIQVAHQTTFGWAESSESQQHIKWDNLLVWLCHGSGCFWINGKAASGKSTLMKHLSRSHIIRQACRFWAGEIDVDVSECRELSPTTADPLQSATRWFKKDRRLLFGSFYFWHLGSTIQKSQQGLLRSLLHSLLTFSEDLIEKVLPLLYQEILLKIVSNDKIYALASSLDELSEAEVKLAFSKAVRYLPTNVKACFFVDGIDEYDGDHRAICSFLRSLTGDKIKMVLSSRPIHACAIEFEGLPSLRLQDLTRGDIQTYVSDNLCKHPEMSSIRMAAPSAANHLIDEIINKASGVFLWIILVVRSVISALENGDTVEDLNMLVDRLPEELMDLYKHMMDSMEPGHTKQAAKYLQLLLESTQVQGNENKLTLLQFLYAEEADRQPQAYVTETGRFDGSNDDILELEVGRLKRRLRSRCCGLIEAPYRQEKVSRQADSAVLFLHKTVSDFLSDIAVQRYIVSLTAEPERLFCPSIPLASSCLQMIRTSIAMRHTSRTQVQGYMAAIRAYVVRANYQGQPCKEILLTALDTINTSLQHARRSPVRHMPESLRTSMEDCWPSQDDNDESDGSSVGSDEEEKDVL